jgi:hypothetical protein
MIAVTLAVMSIASIGGVAIAASGSITGYVQADNGTPINGAHVVAYDWNTGVNKGETHAGISGSYSITSLATGTYRVRADYDRYLPEYYNEGTPTPVPVTDPNPTAGINFTLTTGSSISGYVYQDDNVTPIPIAHVTVYDNVTWEEVADGYASDNGSYSITTGTDNGSYFVRAQLHGWAAEYYDNVSTKGAATQVPVTALEDTPNINFTLTEIGWISGKVYQADGATEIGTATVAAYDNATAVWQSSGGTGADGYYYINLDPGTYRIKATANGYMTQWWENVTVVAPGSEISYFPSATPITPSDNGTPIHNFRLLPALTTGDAGSVATASATLNGALTSKCTNDNVTVSFQYGTATGSYTQFTAGSVMNDTGDFSAPVSSLIPGTTYYFRAKAVGDKDTHPFYGEEKSFTTSTTQPSVTTSAASNPATYSATLNGDLTALGTATNVNVSFEWGLTASYGSVAAGTPPSMTAPGTFSANLTGLIAKTTYHFRAIAAGHGTTPGNDMTFTTSTIPPTMTTNAASNLATTSATLNGDLTALGTAASVNVSFEWGLTTSYGNTTALQAKSATGTFSDNLTGLTAKTTYHFRAMAAGDGTTPGNDATFTTSTIAPTVTTSAATNLATTSATLNGNLTALGTAASVNVSFEWGLTTSYGNTTALQAKSATGPFSGNLTGLIAKTTYHFRSIAAGDGSAVYGGDMTFTTASPADTTAPTISLVTSSGITTTSATITWSTSEAATTQVKYGLTEEYDSTTPEVTSLVTSHSVDLTGLKAGKTYHYQVISKDAANNQAVWVDATFTTASPSGGMPVWAWVLIGLAAVGVAGAAAYFIRGRLAQG